MDTEFRLVGARVLVVDDAPTNLAIAKNLLKRYDLHIDCVTSGADALDAVLDDYVRYDAIFMDYLMPDMDGVETMRLIREIDSDYARNVPVIAITSNTSASGEEMFLQKGFQDFLPKPIDLSRLDAVIRKWITGKKESKPRRIKDKPDPETLDLLREACEEYDVTIVDETIEQLNSFEYEAGGELVGWLAENAELMNYTDIIRKLSLLKL